MDRCETEEEKKEENSFHQFGPPEVAEMRRPLFLLEGCMLVVTVANAMFTPILTEWVETNRCFAIEGAEALCHVSPLEPIFPQDQQQQQLQSDKG